MFGLLSAVSAMLTADVARVACDREQFQARTAGETQVAQERAHKVALEVGRKKLTFLNQKVLHMHTDFLLEMEAAGRTGMILECGVAKAGSAIVMAAAKQPERCLHLFDTFAGIPPPSGRDGKDVHNRYQVIKSGRAGAGYYGYMSDLLEFDQRMFREIGYVPAEHAVTFHKGLFNETVVPAGHVAYAHLDGDWYESVFGVLNVIEPFMVDNGVIVLDDVLSYSGAGQAYKDFFDCQDLSAISRSNSTTALATTRRVTPRGTRFDLFFVHGKYGAIKRRKGHHTSRHKEEF